MADKPGKTAGRISRRHQTTTTYGFGGYTGTLIVEDGARNKVSIKANTNQTTDPMALQPMDVDQMGALITILTELRDEALYPGGARPDPKPAQTSGADDNGFAKEASAGSAIAKRGGGPIIPPQQTCPIIGCYRIYGHAGDHGGNEEMGG